MKKNNVKIKNDSIYKLIIPEEYNSFLNLRQTEEAIKYIKDTFQTRLAEELNLSRVSAPIAVLKKTGINDNLSGVETPVAEISEVETIEPKIEEPEPVDVAPVVETPAVEVSVTPVVAPAEEKETYSKHGDRYEERSLDELKPGQNVKWVTRAREKEYMLNKWTLEVAREKGFESEKLSLTDFVGRVGERVGLTEVAYELSDAGRAGLREQLKIAKPGLEGDVMELMVDTIGNDPQNR